MRDNPEILLRDLIKTNAALLVISIASFILMGAGTALYGPALPVFARSFDIHIGTAGLLISAHWIGCSIGVAAMFFLGPRATPRLVVAAMTIGRRADGAGGQLVADSTGRAAVRSGLWLRHRSIQPANAARFWRARACDA